MIGFDIFNATFIPSLFIALVAGILSFVSPCVLPVVPPYLAYLSGVSIGDLGTRKELRQKTILCALLFVTGLSVVFLVLGLAATAFGLLFIHYQVLLGRLAGLIIIVLGLNFLRIINIPIINRELRFEIAGKQGSAVGAFILGLAFAFGWVPCIGPQLGAILSLAAHEESYVKGGFLLFVYACGLGIPFVLAALFLTRFISVMAVLKKHMRTIEYIIGSLLIIVGVLLLTNRFSYIAYWLLEMFPSLALLG